MSDRPLSFSDHQMAMRRRGAISNADVSDAIQTVLGVRPLEPHVLRAIRLNTNNEALSGTHGHLLGHAYLEEK